MFVLWIVPNLNKNLVVFQSLKVLLSHPDQMHICTLVLRELELHMAPSVLHKVRMNAL